MFFDYESDQKKTNHNEWFTSLKELGIALFRDTLITDNDFGMRKSMRRLVFILARAGARWQWLQKTFIALAGAALVAGCAAGPDFQRPDAPSVQRYTPQPVSDTTSALGHGGKAQRFKIGGQIAADWWRVFHSRQLDSLIEQALVGSPTLQAAKARLQQAEANLDAVQGGLFPQFDLQIGATRGRTGGPLSTSVIGNLFDASLNASYHLDLFGSTRRSVEAQAAQVALQRNQLRASYLTLVGNVVNTAITVASLRGQLDATHAIVKAEKNQLSLVEAKENAGAVPLSSVLQTKAQLAATRTRVAPLRQQLAMAQHRLAVLTGTMPAQWAAVRFELNALTLPDTLPLVVPSKLVEQRPDILAAKSALHAASAQVGVATANLYPHISLVGSYGSKAVDTANLFNVGNTIWNIGVSLLQPLFHGDALHAKKRAAVAGYKQALANYQQTVLLAFGQVADVLHALETDADSLKAQQTALKTARKSLKLTQIQYKAGGASFLAVLTSIQQFQQAQQGYVQALAKRYQDTARLFNALGGGWWNRKTLSSTTNSHHSTEQEHND